MGNRVKKWSLRGNIRQRGKERERTSCPIETRVEGAVILLLHHGCGEWSKVSLLCIHMYTHSIIYLSNSLLLSFSIRCSILVHLSIHLSFLPFPYFYILYYT